MNQQQKKKLKGSQQMWDCLLIKLVSENVMWSSVCDRKKGTNSW